MSRLTPTSEYEISPVYRDSIKYIRRSSADTNPIALHYHDANGSNRTTEGSTNGDGGGGKRKYYILMAVILVLCGIGVALYFILEKYAFSHSCSASPGYYCSSSSSSSSTYCPATMYCTGGDAAPVSCPVLYQAQCPAGTAVAPCHTPPHLSIAQETMEALGPFSSWINMKTQGGAVGDGITDDTDAIQYAIDNYIGNVNIIYGVPPFNWSKAMILYFPAGTYRITRSLTMIGQDGAGWVGEHPFNTTILWDGPFVSFDAAKDVNQQQLPFTPMLILDGGGLMKFRRLTWEGNNKASVGVAHWWNITGVPHYGGSVEHEDEWFYNMEIGIMIGRLGTNFGNGDSETQIKRCKFHSLSKCGVTASEFNALDIWVSDSEFYECNIGMGNWYGIAGGQGGGGAGAVYGYRNNFYNSTTSDFFFGNGGWKGVRDNYSLGSKLFFSSYLSLSGINIIGNTIINTTGPYPLYLGNPGHLFFLDNYIQPLPTATLPLIVMTGDADIHSAILIGNQYAIASNTTAFNTLHADMSQVINLRTSVQQAFYPPDNRLIQIDDIVVPVGSFPSTPPILPSVPFNYNRTVFEVKTFANSGYHDYNSFTQYIISVIQAACNYSQLTNEYSVVHFPIGIYSITNQIIIPARTKIQLVSDTAVNTIFQDGRPAAEQSSSYLVVFEGPSYAMMREIGFWSTYSLQITNADQVGGHIVIGGNGIYNNITLDHIKNTHVEGQFNGGIGGIISNGTNSAVFQANGGLGMVRVYDNGVLYVSDSWQEGSDLGYLRGDSGNLTYIGGNISPNYNSQQYGTGPKGPIPLIELDTFVGQVSFIGASMGVYSPFGNHVITNPTENTNVMFLNTWCGLSGMSCYSNVTLTDTVGLIMSDDGVTLLDTTFQTPQDAVVSPIVPMTDGGKNFLLDSLRLLRAIKWEDTESTASQCVYDPQDGVTSVKVYRSALGSILVSP